INSPLLPNGMRAVSVSTVRVPRGSITKVRTTTSARWGPSAARATEEAAGAARASTRRQGAIRDIEGESTDRDAASQSAPFEGAARSGLTCAPAHAELEPIMSMTLEEVRRIADLSHLAFTDEELRRLAGELDRILDYVSQLAAVDVQGVDPA